MINYKTQGSGETVVLIHGLFGSLGNLGVLARDLSTKYQVISVDLPNHGLSPHTTEFSYEAMAESVVEVLKHENIQSWRIVGHSMGGKVAMKIAEFCPQQTLQLAVLDMAPVHYTVARHDNVFQGLFAVDHFKPTARSEAMHILDEHIELVGVQQFLAKSLYAKDSYMQWRFNLKLLKENYDKILGWTATQSNQTPTLFIKGAESDYILAEHQKAILTQFPSSKAHVIANTGHWLHAEKPQDVLRVLHRFFDKL